MTYEENAIPRKATGKKLGAASSTQKFNGLTDDTEEIEAIRAYDSAKVSGETPIPYQQVSRRIKLSQQ